eukprot:426182-Prymnesium_polylepis.1
MMRAVCKQSASEAKTTGGESVREACVAAPSPRYLARHRRRRRRCRYRRCHYPAVDRSAARKRRQSACPPARRRRAHPAASRPRGSTRPRRPPARQGGSCVRPLALRAAIAEGVRSNGAALTRGDGGGPRGVSCAQPQASSERAPRPPS